jgi:hypothetical protein
MNTDIESPTAPTAVRLLLLALLPLIALGLYLDGQHYDAGLLDFQPAEQAAKGHAGLFPERLAGQPRFGQVRQFDKENLYEYINGHAEYFIGAGFKGLSVGEYGDSGDGQPLVVINLYDMGGALNAFGVLVNESGEQASVELGALGFRSEQGVGFIHGPFYVQLSLFDKTLPLLDTAKDMAEALAAKVPASDLAFRFPDLGAVEKTRFVREYYRGMDFLNEVLERSFSRQGETFQAFVLADPAQEINGKLRRFLDEEDIAYQAREYQELRFFAVEDPYEGDWFFVSLKAQLMGVYATLNEDLMAAIATFAGTPANGTSKP